jgi:hypothetical protein
MGYTITKGNCQSFFSEYITFSINFNVSSLHGITNIQTTFNPFHVPWSMFGVTVATASLIQDFSC